MGGKVFPKVNESSGLFWQTFSRFPRICISLDKSLSTGNHSGQLIREEHVVLWVFRGFKQVQRFARG